MRSDETEPGGRGDAAAIAPASDAPRPTGRSDPAVAPETGEYVVECGPPCPVPAHVGPLVVDRGRAELYFRDAVAQVFVGAVGPGDGICSDTGDGVELLLTVQETLHLRRAVEARRRELESGWIERVTRTLRAERHRVELDTDATYPSVRAFNEAVHAALAERDARRDDARHRRLRGGEDGGAVRDGGIGDSARRALRDAVDALGLPDAALEELSPVASGDVPIDGHGGVDIERLARRIGLRTRRVTLHRGWSRDDQGPLLLRDRDDGGYHCARYTARGYRLADGSPVDVRSDRVFDATAWCVFEPLPPSVQGFWSLARFVLRRNRAELALTARVAAVAAVLGALVPVATGWVLSDIVPSGDARMLVAVALALVFTTLVGGALDVVRALALARIQGRSSLRLSAALYDRLLQLPTRFFKSYTAGDLNQRLVNADDVRALVLSLALTVGLSAGLSIVYLGVLIAFDPTLAALSLLVVGVHVLAVLVVRVLQKPIVTELHDVDGRLAQRAHEMIGAVAKLRSSAAEERALARWSRLYAEERSLSRRAARISALFTAFAEVWQMTTTIILFAAFASLASDTLSVGHFIAFMAAFGIFQGAFVGLASAMLAVYSAQPQIDRTLPILRAEPESHRQHADPGPLVGHVELRSTSFAYDKANTPILRDVSLEVRAGEHVALVGASGSGKSTLLRLLLGFEEPDNGAVLYDGQDLSQLDASRVRRQIGVVLQSSTLFAGSIADNIRGASEASLEDCWFAAAGAGLVADIESFPMGMNTVVTDGGGALSGGQRQRVLIARALVGEPRLLYFDEATSALDNATQAIVGRTLERMAVTRITIAHRLSTVRHADRIGVLHKGQLVEQGRYEELMAEDGVFAALAARQLTDR